MSNAFRAHLAALFGSSNWHHATEYCVSKSLRDRCSGWYRLMVRGKKKLPGFPDSIRHNHSAYRESGSRTNEQQFLAAPELLVAHCLIECGGN